MITNEKINNIIIKLIKAMEDEGINVESPYDVSNFAEDYLCGDHKYIFAAKKFYPDEDDI